MIKIKVSISYNGSLTSVFSAPFTVSQNCSKLSTIISPSSMNSIIYTVDGMQPMKEFLNFTSSVPACPILSHLIVPDSASCNGIASKNIQLV